MSKDLICYGCLSDIGIADTCPHCGFSISAYQQPYGALPLGTQLDNRYILGKVLGSGGFGITYLAYDKRLDVAVAIKEYLPKSLAMRDMTTQTIKPHSHKTEDQFQHHMSKFMEEARAIAKFNNEPGIVSVQDVIELNQTVYIIMHYINGITLEEYVEQEGGRLDFEKTMQIMSGVMVSLNKVHQENLIHRDISPDNIYITKDQQVKLLDFGAARYVVTEESQSLSIILKPGFAPVEQYSTKGKQGPWTDVYAVSASLYWMLTGIKPQNSMDRLMDDELKPLSQCEVGVTPYVSSIIEKGMAILANDRIQSIELLLSYLENSEEDKTVLLEGISPINEKKVRIEKKDKSRRPWLIPSLAIMVCCCLIFLGFVFGQSRAGSELSEGVKVSDNQSESLQNDIVNTSTPEHNLNLSEDDIQVTGEEVVSQEDEENNGLFVSEDEKGVELEAEIQESGNGSQNELESSSGDDISEEDQVLDDHVDEAVVAAEVGEEDLSENTGSQEDIEQVSEIETNEGVTVIESPEAEEVDDNDLSPVIVESSEVGVVEEVNFHSVYELGDYLTADNYRTKVVDGGAEGVVVELEYMGPNPEYINEINHEILVYDGHEVKAYIHEPFVNGKRYLDITDDSLQGSNSKSLYVKLFIPGYMDRAVNVGFSYNQNQLISQGYDVELVDKGNAYLVFANNFSTYQNKDMYLYAKYVENGELRTREWKDLVVIQDQIDLGIEMTNIKQFMVIIRDYVNRTQMQDHRLLWHQWDY